MTRHNKNILLFFFVLIVLVGVGFVLFKVGPETIIEALGVRNILLALFLLGIFGGVSSFTSSVFFSSVIVATTGGLHPLLVAAIGGTGMLIGDMIFYYLGVRGRKAIEDKLRILHKLKNWLMRQPPMAVPLIVYAYTGFTPLPGDILSVALAVGGYPLRKVVLPMWLGNITLLTLLGIISIQGGKLFGI